MKTLKCIFVAGLAVATSFAALPATSGQAWLENYYRNPQPDALPAAVHQLSRSGWFEQTGHTAVGIGFLATVFAKNPSRVDRWLVELNGLPLTHHRLIAAALWQAGHPLGNDLLERLGRDSSVRDDVLRLAARTSTAISDTPVMSPSSMNLQWGAFLASGNDRHIVSILDAMGTDRPGLDTAARQAIAQNAVSHPRVLDICRAAGIWNVAFATDTVE